MIQRSETNGRMSQSASDYSTMQHYYVQMVHRLIVSLARECGDLVLLRSTHRILQRIIVGHIDSPC
jgi:hypothetical protein